MRYEERKGEKNEENHYHCRIARICNYLADNQVNIEDISQTIVQGYFNMIIVADISSSSKSNAEMAKELEKVGEEIGVVIHCQHEDIFNMMHRI